MSQKNSDLDAFRSFESAGWEAKAGQYHAFFQPITGRVIPDLLHAASVGEGDRILDLGTGPGYAAGMAAQRGARVVGADISQHMVDLASTRLPGITFKRADAEELPFADNSFDAVISNFMLPHLPRPEEAVQEAVRVLTADGHIALSTWDTPDESALLGSFVHAVRDAGAGPPADLPAGPDVFRYADDGKFVALLQSAGLQDVRVQCIRFKHHFDTIDDVWNGVLGGGVRISALVLGQDAKIQREIREHYTRLLSAFMVATGLELPVSVKIGSGRKAA